MADAEEDEIAVLTPSPASSEGWNHRQWALHYREHAKALHGRVVELQTQAGVRSKIERLEEGPLFPNIDFRPYNAKAEEGERRREKSDYRHGFRRTLFAIEDENLRRHLIKLERASELAALRFHEAEHLAEHHEFAARVEFATPWVRSACIEALISTIVGGLIGHGAGQIEAVRQVADGATVQVGAVAGAVLGVVGALRQRDYAEQARLKEVANARDQLTEADRIYQSILDEPEIFTSWEEQTGKPSDDFR